MPDPLATAVQHHRDGRVKEAEALYRQVLAAEPDNPEALHLLGVLSLQRGDVQAAVDLIRRAIAVDPTRPGYHFNLGVALASRGDPDGAIAAYRDALALRSDDADAHNNLGLLLLSRNEQAAAAASFRAALGHVPDHIGAGVNLGRLLLADTQPEEALACFDTVLRRDPAQPEALYGRGAAYAAVQRLDRAEQDFRALLAAQPDHAATLNRLGAVLIRQARMDEAIDLLRRGQARHPENSDLLANLASAHEARNDLDAAAEAAGQAQVLSPDAPGPRILLARLDHRRGRLAEARHGLEAALDLQPGDEQRCDALFELGQVLDKLGEAGAAYGAFLEANALHGNNPAARRFDGRRFLKRIESNRAAFTRQGLAALLAHAPQAPQAPVATGGPGPSPVFFVGFPRSGTTLVERALAAHPDIVTTEERSPLTPAIRHLIGRGGTAAALGALGETQLSEARALFWQRAEAVAGPLGGRLLIDKLPLNLVDLGYANLLFPEARVLVALRDPRDVCLSCFMQRFQLNDSMVNFLDLRQTALTYEAVMALWLHYRDVLTLPYSEYRYESLVEDFDGVVRQVLDFIGVGWHDEVARYREKSLGRAISTPSYRDVTGVLYRRAAGRWRSYRQELAPVLEALGPFAAAFGYPED
jgi:tetratricopeptide (TPR) repeat protein